jgi:hypothetical protein
LQTRFKGRKSQKLPAPVVGNKPNGKSQSEQRNFAGDHMKSKNALCGISIAVALQLGVLAGSAQTNIYLYGGSETNITLGPGFYDITAYGAQGGGSSLFGYGGGLGAKMAGRFGFSAPTTLTLLVGGGGGSFFGGGGGGGGGSFVVNGSSPLVVAGGGGGAGVSNGGNANTGTSGGDGVGGTPGGGAGGANGSGGAAGDSGPYFGGGGGGFLSNGGGGGYGEGGGGGSFLSGASGGGGAAGAGGYGGGGGGGGGTGSYLGAGGGGGGYSGGGGGGWGNQLGGGGGGSIINSSAIISFVGVSGIASPDGSPNGEIIITKVPDPTNAPGPFTISAFLINGNLIRSVATADVNGDGKPDLICVRGNPSFLYVWTNSGGGIFVSNAGYAVGSFPYQVIAADVNNDGHPDLITANNSGNSLTVLTNDGHGGYVLSATLAEGSGQAPHSVAAADLFSHGRLDLICANSLTASFTVWSNSGSGNFVSNATYTVGTPGWDSPQWVTTADVNGDGKPDIICADSGSYVFLTVWTNNGVGGFASAPLPYISSGISCVVAADVNGDGWPDLILDTGLTVLTNNRSGGFGLSGTYPVGASAYAVVVADVNGDGAVDLISVNQGNNTLVVLTNNGSGVFGSNATLNVGSGPESLTAADVNGDGRMDLISGDWNDGTLTVLTNFTFFPAPTSTPPVAIKSSGSGLVVSWPLASAGWSLQQNPNLATANWGPSGYGGYSISDDGTNNNLFIPSQPGSLFFRLLHP